MDYPRPDFCRTSMRWQSLNGPWNFTFDDEDKGRDLGWHQTGLPQDSVRTIQVPFVFQCPASQVNEGGVHEVLWYSRTISDLRSTSDCERGSRLLIRFGAVDYHAIVWLEGHYIGSHRGGHVPFDLDLTDAIRVVGQKQGYRIVVRVFDSAHDVTQPRGKQYWGPEPESIFYTPSSGIWQNVWIEAVPQMRVADSSHGTIIRSNNVDKGVIDARIAIQGRRVGQKCAVEIEASFYGTTVSKSERMDLPRDENFVRFDHSMRLNENQLRQLPADLVHDAPLSDPFCWRDGVALWSPEHPALYDLTIRLHNSDTSTLIDEVKTTTGIRSLNWSTGDGTFRLNGMPYFQALFLDQGYWPETLMTPPSPSALKQDIVLSKQMGFNGCRKHQKVEDPIFYYYADRLGFLVWGEMASTYNFSLESTSRFDSEWLESLRLGIAHPSIITWTPVNESWGYPDLGGQARQRDHIRSLYYQTKVLDPSRPINDNCGWEHVITDLSTFHDYADANGMRERCESLQAVLTRGRNMFLGPIQGPNGAFDAGLQHTRGAPVMCTEFGGVNVAVRNDDSRKGNWGYTTASDGADLLKRFEDILMAVCGRGEVCAFVWTQFCDVEQEMNGLYSYDRRPKIPAPEVARIVQKAREAYFAKLYRHR
ncbi:beta-galactosidase [Teratosphaeria nubilosa]|uniref:Beta-galactosidase n=1 Tax=Teratosphaeria nubilosa TaxID=161662 RepID=A0A6G1KUQ5_9PEZI|nr:beta-galactosidase [Teratosphaeria nubilosa]